MMFRMNTASYFEWITARSIWYILYSFINNFLIVRVFVTPITVRLQMTFAMQLKVSQKMKENLLIKKKDSQRCWPVFSFTLQRQKLVLLENPFFPSILISMVLDLLYLWISKILEIIRIHWNKAKWVKPTFSLFVFLSWPPYQ